MHIYGIPNCDTMKKARTWLERHGIEAEFHDYKKQGVPLDVLKKAARQLGWEPLINKKGPSWRKQPEDLKESIKTQRAAFEFLMATPSAIKRPLLEVNGKYHLGFSTEQYQDIFEK